MAGQVSHFVNYAPNFPGDHSYSEKRYKNEYDRLLGVMNNVLGQREYLAGDYSIADMASFPWITAYKRYEVDLDSFENVRRWFDDIKSRPAVRKGIEVGKERHKERGGVLGEHGSPGGVLGEPLEEQLVRAVNHVPHVPAALDVMRVQEVRR